MKKLSALLILLIALISIFPQSNARADVAPPEMPPGSNIVPGTESTQVSMLAETVILTVAQDPADDQGAIARTDAAFTMRNLGAAEETMQARFPLSFFNGNSNGFGKFPEIADIAVKVNGSRVSTRREMQLFLNTDGASYTERDEIPWAVFDVTFPPAQDVKIEVSYTVKGYGYYPYEVFKYVLETGAGWKDSIGVADLIVRFPYEVNDKNVWMQGGASAGYGEPTQSGTFSGNEVRWHFENLEPTWKDNIHVLAIAPSLWKSILRETDTVTKNPKDGEAWGRLGKAYKQVLLQKHGEPRSDPAGLEMFELSKSAYEKCLALLPNDSLWHYGYADLLWSKYYFEIYFASEPDTQGFLPRALSELETALRLDPNNQQAREMLTFISSSVPESVQVDGDNFIFLGLTATPPPPTPYVYVMEGSATPTSMPTETPLPTVAITETSAPPAPTPIPTAKNPICGSAFILPALVVGIWNSRRKRN